MSYLVFNKDDNNCKLVGDYYRAAKYKIKDVRLKYIGECEYREYQLGFDKQYFKIVDPITLSDKFKCIMVDMHEEGVVKIDDEYFIKIGDHYLRDINLKYNRFYISNLKIRITPGRTIYVEVIKIAPLYSDIIEEEINKEYIDLLDDSIKNHIKSFINIPQYDRFQPTPQKIIMQDVNLIASIKYDYNYV